MKVRGPSFSVLRSSFLVLPRVPVAVLLGDKDNVIQKLDVEPLETVRKDWPVIERKAANHLTCVVRRRLREEIAARLKKNAR